MQMESVICIAKEEIPLLQVANTEVHSELYRIIHRKQLLVQGMLAGNNCRNKVRIIFEATDGTFQVETAIWAITDDFVLLKGGVYLPINCIHDVLLSQQSNPTH